MAIKNIEFVCVWCERQIRRQSEFLRNWFFMWKQQEQHSRSTLVDIEFFPLSALDEVTGDERLRVKENWREHGAHPRLYAVLLKFEFIRRDHWQMARHGLLPMWRGEILPATKKIPFGETNGIRLARCIKQLMHPMCGAPTNVQQ